MNASEIVKKAEEHFASLGKIRADGVTGLSKTEEGWVVSLEALERKAIPDTMDILGWYQIRLDAEGNLLGFERKKLRKRGETKEE
ncbi:MAG: gas vesicle protein [Chloroflexi bacterium]|nr:gas vesicle protein [Chloroflexota bacterium]